MTLNFFPFEKLPEIFTMMQFSFRLLEFGGFFLIIVAAIAIGVIIDKFNIYNTLVLICISILLLIPNISGINYGTYFSEEELIDGIRVTSSTGRVHAGCASFEYLPSKAFNNRKYIENRENIPIVLNNNTDNTQIDNYYKEGTNCSFFVKKNDKEPEMLQIELPYIYYIGYNVEYTDETGKEYRINNYESENGFVCINVPNENITVNVKYTGTVFMKIAYTLSSFTAFAIIVIMLKKCIDKVKYKRNSKKATIDL